MLWMQAQSELAKKVHTNITLPLHLLVHPDLVFPPLECKKGTMHLHDSLSYG